MRLTLVNADLPSATPASPLGLVSLAHAATRGGHEVTLRDYQLAPSTNSRDPSVFAKFCRSPDPVLGVSTSGMALPLVLLALRELKEAKPELITVLGGIGAAGADEQIIATFPWIDFVARGEGEESLRELLDRLDRGEDTSTIAGLACRRSGQPRVNPLRCRVTDLDTLTARKGDYLNLAQYSVINLATARGCPFPCTFCDVASYWHRHYTVRSVEAVLEEVREIVERSPESSTFVFVDDTLTIQRQRVEALCQGLRSLPFSMRWGCYARADTLSEELLTLLAAAGCRKVYLGLESGSDHVLERIRKGFDAETGRQAALLAKRHIEIVQTAFVWGFPFETWDDFYQTLLLMGYLVAHGVSVKANVLTPLPFSPLFSDYAGSMVLRPEYSPELHLAGYETHPELMELIRMHPRIFPCFYLYWSETLTSKYDLLRKMALSPEHIWDIWEKMKAPVPVREQSAS